MALHAVPDKGDMHDHVATFLYNPMVGRELIIVDAAASVPAARGKAPAPRPPPSALDTAKLCTMLGRSAGPPSGLCRVCRVQALGAWHVACWAAVRAPRSGV